MADISELLEYNKNWVDNKLKTNQKFFTNLSKKQTPNYLWIGCSDSRVDPSQILGLELGEVFVHRNIGNVVTKTDKNCLSAIEYAVNVLEVRNILLCGHYGCGAVNAAITRDTTGNIHSWVSDISKTIDKYSNILHDCKITNDLNAMIEADKNIITEINVIEQVLRLSELSMIQDVWTSGRQLVIYGLIYSVKTGLIKKKFTGVHSTDSIKSFYQDAFSSLIKSSNRR